MQLLGRTLSCSHILPTEKDITQNILIQTATGIKEEKAVKGTCMHTHSFNTTCHFQPSLSESTLQIWELSLLPLDFGYFNS